MPTICDQLLPIIRSSFREAARRITEGQARGGRSFGMMVLGDQTVRCAVAYGPHRDQSGDSSIFVSVAGAIIRDKNLKQSLADEFGYIRVRHTMTKHVVKTEYYITLKPELIAKLAEGEAL